MSDLYFEHIVKRKTPTMLVVAKGVMLGITVAAFVMGVLAAPILLIAGVVLGIVDYFVFPRWDVEFEYLFVNGEMDVDKIMSKSKRKKMGSFELSRTELVAPYNSHDFDSYRNKQMKTLDFSSGIPDHKIYGMIVEGDQELLKILFEPNEKILQAMKSMAPRKVMI